MYGSLRTDAKPNFWVAFTLSLIPFVLMAGGYLTASYQRHLVNPQDKVMPTLSKIATAFERVALKEDRKGDVRLYVDTVVSAKRFFISLGIIFGGVILGLNMGLFPYVEAVFLRFVTFFDKIPALCVLPILFILFGLGELSKIALIVIGVLPTIALDAYLRAKAIPRQMIYKAQTLGATEQEIAYRVVLPQIFPEILDTIRLNFKSMILLLIAGESLAASAGLGYRIFVVRRYVAMDIILNYVIWMTILLFLMDGLVTGFIRWRYRWLNK